MCDELKKICENYLIGVFNELFESSNIDDDWWHDTFLFESTNNYIEGKYDIMKSDIDTKFINSYVKENIYNIIQYINTFYEFFSNIYMIYFFLNYLTIHMDNNLYSFLNLFCLMTNILHT